MEPETPLLPALAYTNLCSICTLGTIWENWAPCGASEASTARPCVHQCVYARLGSTSEHFGHHLGGFGHRMQPVRPLLPALAYTNLCTLGWETHLSTLGTIWENWAPCAASEAPTARPCVHKFVYARLGSTSEHFGHHLGEFGHHMEPVRPLLPALAYTNLCTLG